MIYNTSARPSTSGGVPRAVSTHAGNKRAPLVEQADVQEEHDEITAPKSHFQEIEKHLLQAKSVLYFHDFMLGDSKAKISNRSTSVPGPRVSSKMGYAKEITEDMSAIRPTVKLEEPEKIITYSGETYVIHSSQSEAGDSSEKAEPEPEPERAANPPRLSRQMTSFDEVPAQNRRERKAPSPQGRRSMAVQVKSRDGEYNNVPPQSQTGPAPRHLDAPRKHSTGVRASWGVGDYIPNSGFETGADFEDEHFHQPPSRMHQRQLHVEESGIKEQMRRLGKTHHNSGNDVTHGLASYQTRLKTPNSPFGARENRGYDSAPSDGMDVSIIHNFLDNNIKRSRTLEIQNDTFKTAIWDTSERLTFISEKIEDSASLRSRLDITSESLDRCIKQRADLTQEVDKLARQLQTAHSDLSRAKIDADNSASRNKSKQELSTQIINRLREINRDDADKLSLLVEKHGELKTQFAEITREREKLFNSLNERDKKISEANTEIQRLERCYGDWKAKCTELASKCREADQSKNSGINRQRNRDLITDPF